MFHLPPIVATLLVILGIIVLFSLRGDDGPPPSKALWIPMAWLFLVSSRYISMWLGLAPTMNTPQAFTEGSPIDRIVFIGLIVAALLVVIDRAEQVGPLLRGNAPVVLFFSFCAVSIFWSDFPFVAVKRWIKAVGDVLMVLIIVTEPDPLEALLGLITRLGFLLFPLSVLFIKYYPALGRVAANSGMEFTGVAMQKNQLGIICVVYGLGFLWILRRTYRERSNPHRRRRLWAYAAIVFTIGWLLLRCNALTSITALTVAGSLMWLATKPALIRNSALVHILVLAAIMGSLFAVFFDSSGLLLSSLGRDSTLTGRTLIWSLVLQIPNSPWLGAGFESFWLGDRLLWLRDALPNLPINEAHNGYLEVYLNLGWIGVGFLGLLLATGYRRVIAMLRRNPEMGSLFLGFFIAALIYSLTEAAFRMMSSAWIFFLIATFGASRANVEARLTQAESDLIQPEPEAADASVGPVQPPWWDPGEAAATAGADWNQMMGWSADSGVAAFPGEGSHVG